MKIRNIAFCGVMASILTGWGALADTIIASKAYVDARDDTKQDSANRIQTTKSDYDTGEHTDAEKKADYPSMYTLDTAISGLSTAIGSGAWGSNALDSTQTGYDTNKITKVSAITSSVIKSDTSTGTGANTHTGIGTTTTASDNYLPTEKAVANAISTASGNITNQFEREVAGNILSLQGQAFTDADAVAHNTIADRADPNLIPRNYDIQKGVAYLKGTGIKNMTANVDNTNAENVGIKNETVASTAKTSWDTNILAGKHGDEFVPTVAAVERRVQAAEAIANGINQVSHSTTANATALDLTNATDKAPSVNMVKALADTTDAATIGESGTTITVRDGDDKHFYTADAAEAGFTAVKTAISRMDSVAANDDDTTTGKAVIGVSETDGIVTVTKGKLSYKDAMQNALRDINSASAAAACSVRSPCVLTYTGTDFKWTNMDTEGVDAVPNS